MSGNYYIGQRNPVSDLADEKFTVTDSNTELTVDQIREMSAFEYETNMRKPGFLVAVNQAFARAAAPPEPTPEPVAPAVAPTEPPQ